MPEDLYSMMTEIAKKAIADNTSHGIVAFANYYEGLEGANFVDAYVSDETDERWFLMGISTWGADSEGNADIVGE
jgi:hypothetical protein